MKIELPKITPGEWHLDHNNPSRVVSDQLEFVASVYNPHDDGMERETEQPDARAISALPDLLRTLASLHAGLTDIYELCDGMHGGTRDVGTRNLVGEKLDWIQTALLKAGAKIS